MNMLQIDYKNAGNAKTKLSVHGKQNHHLRLTKYLDHLPSQVCGPDFKSQNYQPLLKKKTQIETTNQT
jgi:hypothetical protein